MQIGLVYPQTELGDDPVVVRDYAQAAEALGFSHILTYEHVLGANPNRPGGWNGPYTYQDPFLDPFVLFAYMAGVTQTLTFATGILILPQRETAVVAKQVATLMALSNGRFRFGVGVGWNEVEYVALNQNFHTRGRRMEEQLEVLDRLWNEELVTYAGEWHTIPDAGLNPRPVQPVPVWFGGHADVVLRRLARWGAGWFPGYRRAADAQPLLDKLDGYLAEYGRSRADVGIEWRLHWVDGAHSWESTMTGWQGIASHMSLNTMNAGLSTPEEHMQAMRLFAAEFL
jgi:probable F420-dependent oxidoreductase